MMLRLLLRQFANLLGVPNPKALIKTDFTRFMAQPFMQLHAKWMRVSSEGGRDAGLSWWTLLKSVLKRVLKQPHKHDTANWVHITAVARGLRAGIDFCDHPRRRRCGAALFVASTLA